MNSSVTLSRRHSSPVLHTPDNAETEPRIYIPSRKRSSLPPMPLSPLLEPIRLPSITELARSSWRLSFASGQRGEHLRKLSQGHDVPVTLSVDKWGGSAQPVRYLHDKGLRASSQVVQTSEDNTNLESLAPHSHTCSESHDFGGVDGVGDGSAIMHLHEMGISQRLASRGQSSSSPQLSIWGFHERGVSSNANVSIIIPTERARYMRKTSDSLPLSERIPQSWGQVIHDNTSSVYLSASNSLQPSRESSRFNLSSFLQGSRHKLDFEESKGEHVIALSLSRSHLPTPMNRVRDVSRDGLFEAFVDWGRLSKQSRASSREICPPSPQWMIALLPFQRRTRSVVWKLS